MDCRRIYWKLEHLDDEIPRLEVGNTEQGAPRLHAGYQGTSVLANLEMFRHGHSSHYGHLWDYWRYYY